MPHLTLEYTTNLDRFSPDTALASLNQAMLDSALFGESDIKSRAVAVSTFKVGVADAARAFIHIRCALLAGRSDEQRKALAERLLAALQATLATPFAGELQLSVETLEIDRPSYAKAVIHGC